MTLPHARLCFVDMETVTDPDPDCSHAHLHTPSPPSYLNWHEWAGKQARAGRRQRRCPGCGLLRIWTGGKA